MLAVSTYKRDGSHNKLAISTYKRDESHKKLAVSTYKRNWSHNRLAISTYLTKRNGSHNTFWADCFESTHSAMILSERANNSSNRKIMWKKADILKTTGKCIALAWQKCYQY